MMVPAYLHTHSEKFVIFVFFLYLGDRPVADNDMLLHLSKLFISKFARFQQYRVGDAYLAYVMEGACLIYSFKELTAIVLHIYFPYTSKRSFFRSGLISRILRR